MGTPREDLCGLFAGRWTLGELVAFHPAHKLTLMAHSPEAYRQLGRLVAGGRAVLRLDLERRYTKLFMSALTVAATTRRHVNVLQHVAGYFKNRLDADAKRELGAAIDDYRSGLVPLAVPITLLRHHVRMHRIAYLEGQRYLIRGGYNSFDTSRR